MRQRLAFLFPAAVLLIGTGAFAQTPDIEFHQVGYEGPRFYVWSIIQDTDGFIWYAGRGAIRRFDGRRIDEYDIIGGEWEDRSRRRISTLCMDAGGDLWAGGRGGLVRYDRDGNSWHAVLPGSSDDDACLKEWIKTIHVDSRGDLWFRTSRIVAQYRKGCGVIRILRHDSGSDSGLPDGPVCGLFQGTSGHFLIAVKGGHLIDLDPATGRMEPVAFAGNLDFRDKVPEVRCLLDEGDRGLLISTSEGLIHHDRKSGESRLVVSRYPSVSYTNKSNARAMCRDSTGRLWVGTLADGFHEVVEEEGTSHIYRFAAQNPWSIPSNDVNAIFEDRSGVIWVGTSRGLCRFKGVLAHFILHRTRNHSAPEEPGALLRCIFTDSEGKVWVGTQKRGLLCMSRSRNRFKWYQNDSDDPASLSHDCVMAITEGPDGYLWFGTDERGLSRWNPENDEFHCMRHVPGQANSPASDRITALHFDPQGILWIGYRDGLGYYDPRNNRFSTIEIPLKRDTRLFGVNRNGIYPAKGNGLWITTNHGDLFHLDRKTGEMALKPFRQANPEGRPIRLITSLFDRDGSTVWIGSNAGLMRFDVKTGLFHQFNQPGLQRFVMGMLLDDAGMIWISTSWYGLLCFDPAEATLNSFLTPENVRGRFFTTYAWHRSPSGEMFFACRDGVLCFCPDSLTTGPYDPNLKMTRFSVLGESRKPTQSTAAVPEFDLEYDDRLISFEFAALEYSDPDGVRHAYRLLGMSDDWNHCGLERIASYAKLTKGRYVFQVKAANAAGIWSEPKDLAVIHVEAAPWQTWWFRLTVIAGLAVFIYVLWQWRGRRIRAQNKALGIEISKRTAELKSAQEALIEGERLAAIGQVTATVSHEIRNPLSTIAASAYSIRSRMTDEKAEFNRPLDRIERNVARCVRITEELLDFSRNPRIEPETTDVDDWLAQTLQSEDLPDNLTVRFEPGTGILMDLDRHWLGRCLRNLVMNAYEASREMHADPDPVIVTVESEVKSDRLEIRVRDKGPGVSENDLDRIFEPLFSTRNFGSGLGLPFVKRLMELMKGGISITSRDNAGTTATLWIEIGYGARAISAT